MFKSHDTGGRMRKPSCVIRPPGSCDQCCVVDNVEQLQWQLAIISI